MKFIFPVFVSLFFFLMSSTAIAEDCLLNQEYFQSEAKALVNRHAGAKYYEEDNLVRWDSKDLGRISVIIGGCENFGLEIFSERKAARSSSRDAILRAAKRLVMLGWPEPYGREAVAVLSKKAHSIKHESSGVVFEYEVSGYMEFIVTQSFVGGVEKISVSATHLQ